MGRSLGNMAIVNINHTYPYVCMCADTHACIVGTMSMAQGGCVQYICMCVCSHGHVNLYMCP